MDRHLKKLLNKNGHGNKELLSELENVKPEDADAMARGMEIVHENWDCEPNGGVIDHITEYLRSKNEE